MRNRSNTRKLFIGCLLLLIAPTFLAAHGELPRPSLPFPKFVMTQGNLDADQLPTSGAKLCTVPKRDVCFQMPSHKPEWSKVAYEFGLEPRAERLPVPGGSWIFFSSTFSGGGSGTFTRLAVLRYEKNEKITNLLNYEGVTDVSDRAMWSLPKVSPYPVLAVADFIWADGKTHFSSHYYNVRVWTYDPKSDRYTQAIAYKTARKYDSGDRAPVRVLAPESKKKKKRLSLRSSK